ncbi:helix-turn-helix domain-containing protein [Paenibacillus nasutitermitis]|uniref:HTH araC/xylS-type domain-containing protein n=1 Tax=Paenibacillus nasutitermitis TaxID=1652958 RepID=A0A916YNP5_9BACL|nr:AraC family transcriptional regulator [Paenibacillus nasutitermitis]GGD53667.1 hypothetical protein GCM10010911_09020 [Paenibacillus nasutitermitis]
MRSLKDITPHVGIARPYLYDGSINERKRSGNCYAFHLFMGGKGSDCMTLEERTIPLSKGVLVFVRPGQPHSFVIPPGSPVHSHNVYCDLWQKSDFRSTVPQFTYSPFPYRKENETTQESCQDLDRLPSVISLSAYPHLMDNFIYLSRVFKESGAYRAEMANSLFYAWILELHHQLFEPRATDQRIVRILREIDAHPERRLSYEQWSEACGMRKSYFYELFKKESGLPLHEYIVKSRLNKAVAALQETGRTITSIAIELGYTSINHFTRQFTAHFGVSPSRYRSSVPPS